MFTQRFNIKDVENFSDEDFFDYLEDRKKIAENLTSGNELQQLGHELFRRILVHEKRCVDEMNHLLNQLNNNTVSSEYSQLLEMAVKFMYEAESIDELNMYYDYLTLESPETVEGSAIEKGGIREVFSAAGIKIPETFWQILKDLKDTRLIHLETEKKHWQNVNKELGKLAIGATQVLPLTDVAYTLYAWGTWGGMKGFNDFKVEFEKKAEPSALGKFWQKHKTKIIVGFVATVLVGAAIAAPFVIPAIPVIAGLSVATVALIKTITAGVFLGGSAVLAGGLAIKLGYDEKQRTNRVTNRLNQFQQLIDKNHLGMKNFIKNKVEKSASLKPNSYLKVNKKLEREKQHRINKITVEVNSVIRECRKIERKRRPKSVRNLKLMQELTDLGKEIQKQGAPYFSENCENIIKLINQITPSDNGIQQINNNIDRLRQLRESWLQIISPRENVSSIFHTEIKEPTQFAMSMETINPPVLTNSKGTINSNEPGKKINKGY